MFVYIDSNNIPFLFNSAQAAQLFAVRDNCVLPEEGHHWDREGFCLDLYVKGSCRKVTRVWERRIADEVAE